MAIQDPVVTEVRETREHLLAEAGGLKGKMWIKPRQFHLQSRH